MKIMFGYFELKYSPEPVEVEGNQSTGGGGGAWTKVSFMLQAMV